MAIEFTSLELTELKPKIAVVGVGGAGGNAINNMVEGGVQGVEFIAANTDAQALSQSEAKLKIQLGVEMTEGLGAGSHPDVGRAAAEEAIHQIEDALSGCHMVFVTAGMGGGTGTGAAPVIAKIAKNKGVLTVGVVTKPFAFEGSRRMKLAEEGIFELQPFVDTLIVIPNQNLFRVVNKETTFADAFAMADEVLCSGVRGITDLMMQPGLINLDFADIKTIMQNMGTAMMGTGEATGEDRAQQAAETAVGNPLLEEMSLDSAKGVVINITGGPDLTLFEVDEAANHIRKEVDENANIIVGSAFRDELKGKMRVSIVATGVTYMQKAAPRPAMEDNSEAEETGGLHFVPEEDVATEAPANQDYAAADREEDQSAAMEAGTPEPVGVVDDFEMPEAQKPEDFKAPEGDPDPFAEADYVNPEDEDEKPVPDYQRTEKQGTEVSAFVRENRESLFEESLDFVEEEDEPPLQEEASEEKSKPSLFQRMTSGIKGIFSSGSETVGGRPEPAFSDFSDEVTDDDETDNVLSIENRIDSQIEDEEEKETEAREPEQKDTEEEDDQLSIPEFLKKQA